MKVLAFLTKQSFRALFIILILILQLLFPFNVLLSESQATNDGEDGVISIHLIGDHNSDKYWYGQCLMPLKINAYMESGNHVGSIPVEKSWISGYNSEKLGKQTVTITYGGKLTTFTVTVIDYLKDIKVVGLKQNYKVGETLNLSDISITEITASGINKPGNPVTTDMIKGFNTSTEGTKKLTINYGKNELGVDMKIETFITVSNSHVIPSSVVTSPEPSVAPKLPVTFSIKDNDNTSIPPISADMPSQLNNIVNNIFKSINIKLDENTLSSAKLFISIITKLSIFFI